MADSSERRVVWINAILGYLCLLAIFSTFLINVHQSLQEKRYRYLMADLLSEKRQRERDVSVARARVDYLRRLERLEALCQDGRLPLGPPELPVLLLPLDPDRTTTVKKQPGEHKSRAGQPDSLNVGDIALAGQGRENGEP